MRKKKKKNGKEVVNIYDDYLQSFYEVNEHFIEF